MKSEIPKPVLFGIVGVLVAIVAFFAYSSFIKGPEKIEPTTVSAERLEDPDRPHASQMPGASTGN